MKICLFSICLLLFLSACHSWKDRPDYISIYQAGQIQEAENLLDQFVQFEMPTNQFTQSKDAVILLLDRATIRFAMGDSKGATRDYQMAIEAIDYYNQECLAEVLAQVTLEDEVSAYPGEDFEQILARVYFALALLQEGDENNAFAILRQAEELQQQKREAYRKNCLTQDYKLVDNPIAKYLMAALLEHQGDFSNASILYNQTEKLVGKDLDKLLCKEKDRNNATLIIVAHNGNAPYKISAVSNASRASALALEMMLGVNRIPPAYSSLTGIPVPVLMQQILSHPVPVCTRIYRQEKDLIPIYNVTAIEAEQLEERIPLILARGVARLALRRGAVAYLNEKDPCLGSLADFGMLVANACTQADTRSWRTLPASIDIARYDLPPGEHTLHIQVEWGVFPSLIEEFPLKLDPGAFCVINLFNIHPGYARVQIPFHCKNNINKEFCYDLPASNDENKPFVDSYNSF